VPSKLADILQLSPLLCSS